ncbi:hypothetical protein [Nonomuraea sp. NPDC023979]|uniref:hypothetical protein n=1 Tax=Nonomuraea sp. NPDC023979 TaxID=3154796 RepID=UPI0033D9F7AE
MLLIIKAFAKKLLIGFGVVCLVVFAVKRPDMLGTLIDKIADGVIVAINAGVTLLEKIASE